MRVTSTQRWVTIGLLLLFAFLSLEAADRFEWAWYFVAVVLVALAWLVLQLPPATAASPRLEAPVMAPTKRNRGGWGADVDRAVGQMSWDWRSRGSAR